MEKNFAKIVLLGRSSKKQDVEFNQSLLGNINPTEIPKEFIDSIDITFNNGKVVEFNTERLNENFTLEAVEKFLKEHSSRGQVTLLEIVLDLDLVHEVIQAGADNIFSKYFE